jgi:hypothetical protein
MAPPEKKLYLGRAEVNGKGEPVGDRRHHQTRDAIDPRDLGSIEHDHRGDAVFQWHPQVPGRRPEDPTIDYLEALDVDGLSLEDDADGELTAIGNCNPYDHDR